MTLLFPPFVCLFVSIGWSTENRNKNKTSEEDLPVEGPTCAVKNFKKKKNSSRETGSRDKVN